MFSLKFSSKQIKGIVAHKLVTLDKILDSGRDLGKLTQTHLFYLLVSNYLKKGRYIIDLDSLVILNRKVILQGEYQELSFVVFLIPGFLLKQLSVDLIKEIEIRIKSIQDIDAFKKTIKESLDKLEEKEGSSFAKNLQSYIINSLTQQRQKLESFKFIKANTVFEFSFKDAIELLFLKEWKT